MGWGGRFFCPKYLFVAKTHISSSSSVSNLRFRIGGFFFSESAVLAKSGKHLVSADYVELCNNCIDTANVWWQAVILSVEYVVSYPGTLILYKLWWYWFDIACCVVWYAIRYDVVKNFWYQCMVCLVWKSITLSTFSWAIWTLLKDAQKYHPTHIAMTNRRSKQIKITLQAEDRTTNGSRQFVNSLVKQILQDMFVNTDAEQRLVGNLDGEQILKFFYIAWKSRLDNAPTASLWS